MLFRSRNGDGIIGNPASIEEKDKETPMVELKGLGTDKFVWDASTNSLFIIGKHSGYIQADVHLESTRRLKYGWEKYTSSGLVTIDDDYEDQRDGTVRYKLTLPAEQKTYNKYKLSMETVMIDTDSELDLKMDPIDFNIYHLEKLTDLLRFEVEGTTELDLTFSRLIGLPGKLGEISNNPKIRGLIDSGLMINNKLVMPGIKTKFTPAPKEFTLTKDLGEGGVYSEVIKSDNITIRTNINPGITEADESGQWEFEGEIVVNGKDKYAIPSEINNLINDGYTFDMIVVADFNSAKTNPTDVWNDLNSQPTKVAYNKDNISTFKPSAPFNGQIGFRIGKVIPVYKFMNLNLQPKGYSQGSTTLEAYGNANIQYDKDVIYNKITNKSIKHGQYVMIGGKWASELYYRVEGGVRELVLITRDKIVVYDPNTLQVLKETDRPNTGSAILGNKLYIGTTSNLYRYKINEDPVVDMEGLSVNHIATNGVNLFIADNMGLKVLNNKLEIVQTLTNSELGVSRVESLHASQGKIYIGLTRDGNEFIVLGK